MIIQPIQTLKEVLKDVPKGLYHWGNRSELYSLMRTKKDIYPLIWWEVADRPIFTKKSDINSRFVECECMLVIATVTKNEWLNDEREIETFEKVIYPTAELIQKTISKSKFIEVINEIDVSLPIPNIYVELESKDYWDSIVLRFNARFSKVNCLT